ncbi:hypothetical protein acdb102_33430 [Acidothermaceae bacterium B102]|nr:hypothetical protein acdb102_33430 [Acidothermaceae bacterium B102]
MLRALHQVIKSLHASLDLTVTLDAVARGVIEATCFAVAAVNLVRPDGTYEVVSVAGSDEARVALLGQVATAASWQRLRSGAQHWGDLWYVDHDDALAEPDEMTMWVPDIEASADPDMWHPNDALFAPLTALSGELVGVLSVDVPIGGRRPGPEQLELLALFADHAAIAIEHSRLHSSLQASRDEVEHAATHDPLTGLANRALLSRRARAMAGTHASQLAVLVLDVDRFKAVNDTAGHQAGDEILQALARRMRRCVRDEDVLARTGGDEFVIVLAGDDLDEPVHNLVDRLNATLSAVISARGSRHHVSVSIGAAIAATPADFAEVAGVADARMYAAKRAARPTSVAG